LKECGQYNNHGLLCGRKYVYINEKMSKIAKCLKCLKLWYSVDFILQETKHHADKIPEKLLVDRIGYSAFVLVGMRTKGY